MSKVEKKPSRNKIRRDKYKDDPDYRDGQIARSRKSYRSGHNVTMKTCEKTLDFVDELAKFERVLYSDGTAEMLPVFTIPQAAEALQQLYTTVWRWVKKNQLPAPVLALANRRDCGVYHLEEVRVFVEIMAEHQKNVRYYRADHAETRAALFSRVKEVRKDLNIRGTK